MNASGSTLPGNDGSENGQQQDGKDDKKPPYTMHGVLHFIQHEWGRYEMERAKWEMERAELQARITFLQGERKGQENLKHDLVRRIKMLEYCLKQERAKYYRITHNGEDPPEEYKDEDHNEKPSNTDEDTFNTQQPGFKYGRQLLKKYLEEIGYSETVLDVRSFRTRNLMGLLSSENIDSEIKRKKPKDRSDSDSDKEDDRRGPVDNETADALSEFKFLDGDDDWEKNVNHNALEVKIEQYKKEKLDKQRFDHSTDHKHKGTASSEEGLLIDDPMLGDFPSSNQPSVKTKFLDINDALGISPDDSIDIKDSFAGDDDDRQLPKWNLALTLRPHMDVVRAMQFHPVEPVVFTASEDGSCRMWGIDLKIKEDKHSDMEPIYTFRGNYGPTLCMDLSPTGDQLYTGGRDGVICCWKVPSSDNDAYDKFEPDQLFEKFVGHTDSVWSVLYHSSENHIVSSSADGSIRIWELGTCGESPLLKTYNNWREGCTPTSIDFVSTEAQHLLTAFTNNVAGVFDIERGEMVVNFDIGEADETSTINKIISHPTMATCITGSDDRKLRYFDNRTGEMTHCAVAHVDAISSLAVDPNGLYLLSGSHDGSLRLWNMEKRVCLQEIAAHRKKFDSAVESVAFHPSRPYIGSSGADSLTKVYTPSGSSSD